MSTASTPALDMNKLNEFVGKFVTDLGAAVHAGMVVIGEKLGLYKALAKGPMSSAELAAKTQTDERYLREWLASQAAGGYVTYDDQTDKFSLTAGTGVHSRAGRQSGVFAGSIRAGAWLAERRATHCGVISHRRWHGMARARGRRFSRLREILSSGICGESGGLVDSGIAGVQAKLERGAKVADVGCGKGASTILMAKAFPKSRFHRVRLSR